MVKKDDYMRKLQIKNWENAKEISKKIYAVDRFKGVKETNNEICWL